jgi:AhpD family alkylhydroperoxidase
VTTNPLLLIGIQLLDGINGSVLGVLTALIVADLFGGVIGFVGIEHGLDRSAVDAGNESAEQKTPAALSGDRYGPGVGLGERIQSTDRAFFLKVAHCRAVEMYDSVGRVQGERSLADALLREPHYLSRRKHQTTGGKHGKFRYPPASRELSQKRRALAPDIEAAFDAFSQRVFAEGALLAKTKQVIAVAVAHVTQCPYCIKGHTKAALRHGATPEELMEAIWVAAEMRAGGAYAHSGVSLVAMDEAADQAPSS